MNDGEAVVEESKSIFKKLSEYVPSGLKFYSFITKLLEHLKIAQSGFPITTDHNHLWYVLSKFNEIGTITITSLKTGKLSLSSGSAIKNKFSEAIRDLTKLTATKDPLLLLGKRQITNSWQLFYTSQWKKCLYQCWRRSYRS